MFCICMTHLKAVEKNSYNNIKVPIIMLKGVAEIPRKFCLTYLSAVHTL